MEMILASHGTLASGMKSAVEMIIGTADFIECYDLDEYKMPSTIFEIIKNVEDKIIITDIFGGSVNNSLLRLAEKNLLITGMNLGLVLELCFHRNDADLKENVKKIITKTNRYICFVNDEIKECEGGDNLW